MDAAELARDVNATIYDIAVRLGGDVLVDFLCECGCMALVPRLPADYALQGAVRSEHVGQAGIGDSDGVATPGL